jgi:hypothetical protein
MIIGPLSERPRYFIGHEWLLDDTKSTLFSVEENDTNNFGTYQPLETRAFESTHICDGSYHSMARITAQRRAPLLRQQTMFQTRRHLVYHYRTHRSVIEPRATTVCDDMANDVYFPLQGHRSIPAKPNLGQTFHCEYEVDCMWPRQTVWKATPMKMSCIAVWKLFTCSHHIQLAMLHL